VAFELFLAVSRGLISMESHWRHLKILALSSIW